MLRAPKDVGDSSQHPATPIHLIDPCRERLIALARLGSWYEERTGRRLHRCVPYRWRQRGVRSADGRVVRLPTIQLGGVRYTSEEAIAWWTTAIDRGASHEAEVVAR